MASFGSPTGQPALDEVAVNPDVARARALYTQALTQMALAGQPTPTTAPAGTTPTPTTTGGIRPFPGFQNWNPAVPGFPYANLLEQLAASMGTINPGTYGRFGAGTTTTPTVTPKADVGGLLGGGTGGGSTGNIPAGTNDPGFGAGFGSGGLLGGLPSNIGGAPQTSYGVAPSGLSLGSNAVGVDPATGRQILRAPDGSTRLGARPLPSFTPQQFSTALASNPQAAYWMLARGGTPAQNTMMQASGLDQTGINQFINRYAPGIGQVYGPSGWIPTR